MATLRKKIQQLREFMDASSYPGPEVGGNETPTIDTEPAVEPEKSKESKESALRRAKLRKLAQCLQNR